MRQQEALVLLANHQNALKDFGVESLILLGSQARDKVQPDSDIEREHWSCTCTVTNRIKYQGIYVANISD
ncbi:hypothetical protein RIF25_00240 [Thermosynechococcaceae cyanobacterium BACA0444]|uniref:Uncharacterized protein n=1 Tax=Pseudocalidococcus azoricus BACA0444 TaxID=2918990 RepID=A0AAE4FPB4_9CYAN|nr:hypothetical protein [Pseudocalidococcus azoricus]MDS3859223.1 hypothetical protein [Pseudocalidococcus azoricus BACA0444]